MKSRRIIGHRIERFREVDSTNDIAKEIAKRGAPEGTVILADVQKGGRGRLGRKWSSPPGGVWLSVILRPDTESERVSLLPLVAGTAVANALNALYDVDAHVKWPNDVLIRGRKACGILPEIDTYEKFVVMGIGINANLDREDLPEDVRETAATLKDELKRDVSREELLESLFSELQSAYDLFSAGKAPVNCGTVGRQVRVITKEKELTGIAVEVDDTGALILQLEDGSKERVISGDCIHLSS